VWWSGYDSGAEGQEEPDEKEAQDTRISVSAPTEGKFIASPFH